jgi:hypothetical protein
MFRISKNNTKLYRFIYLSTLVCDKVTINKNKII